MLYVIGSIAWIMAGYVTFRGWSMIYPPELSVPVDKYGNPKNGETDETWLMRGWSENSGPSVSDLPMWRPENALLVSVAVWPIIAAISSIKLTAHTTKQAAIVTSRVAIPKIDYNQKCLPASTEDEEETDRYMKLGLAEAERTITTLRGE